MKGSQLGYSGQEKQFLLINSVTKHKKIQSSGGQNAIDVQ